MSDENIRSKRNLVSQNIIRLLNLFMEKESLSVSNIETALETKKRQTVYNYINKLQDLGCIFTKTIYKRRTYYSLDNKDAKEVQLLLYEPLNLNTLRKYSILKDLQSNPVHKKNTLYKNTPDIQKSQFYELFNELLKEKEIYQSEEVKRFYLTGKTFTPMIQFDFNELEALYYELAALPSTTSHSLQYQSLLSRL